MKHRLVRGKFTIATTLVVIAAAGCELAPPPLAVAPVAYFEGCVEDGRPVSLRTWSTDIDDDIDTNVEASDPDALDLERAGSDEQALTVIPEDRNGVAGTSAIANAVELTTETATRGYPDPRVTVDGCGPGVASFASSPASEISTPSTWAAPTSRSFPSVATAMTTASATAIRPAPTSSWTAPPP